MFTTRRATYPMLVLLLVPMLAGSKCNKKKGVDDELGDDSLNDGAAAQDIDVSLSVVSLSPSTADVGTPLDATLRGSGFERGARVYVGASALTDVVWNSASSLSLGIPGLPADRYDIEVVNPNGESSLLREGLIVGDDAPACASVTVHFELDAAALRSDAIAELSANLDCYRNHNGPLLIEGHADVGTTDYNLALGERRAESVAQWLASNGLGRARLSTLSYGEERPVDMGHDEVAWSANRRVEILLSR